MKRLPAMHDCPLFWVRAVTAVATAVSRSALGMTMNGSEPPSSSTDFFTLAAARRGDRAAGGLGAGERDGLHAGVVDDRFDLAPSR